MFHKFVTVLLVVVAITLMSPLAEAYKMHCQAQGYCVSSKDQCPGFIMDDASGCFGKLCCIEDL